MVSQTDKLNPVCKCKACTDTSQRVLLFRARTTILEMTPLPSWWTPTQVDTVRNTFFDLGWSFAEKVAWLEQLSAHMVSVAWNPQARAEADAMFRELISVQIDLLHESVNYHYESIELLEERESELKSMVSNEGPVPTALN